MNRHSRSIFLIVGCIALLLMASCSAALDWHAASHAGEHSPFFAKIVSARSIASGEFRWIEEQTSEDVCRRFTPLARDYSEELCKTLLVLSPKSRFTLDRKDLGLHLLCDQARHCRSGVALS